MAQTGTDGSSQGRPAAVQAPSPRPDPDAEPVPPAPRALRRQGLTVAAGLALWAALVAPDRLGDLGPAAFLRIPLEVVAVGAVLLVLPGRARTVLAAVAGATLGLLTVVRLLDLGYGTALGRRFDLVGDWGSLGPAVGVLRDSVGERSAVVLAALAAGLTLALVAALTLAALRVSRTVARHRADAARAVGATGVAWALCALLGVTSAGLPVASAGSAALLTDHVRDAWSGVQEQRAFAARLDAPRLDAPQPRVDVPQAPGVQAAGPPAPAAPPWQLSGLRGKDVLLVFVEAYGRVAVEGSDVAPRIGAVLAEGTRALDAAGFSSRSAFLTSPVFGGGSWLAHATLQSGLWVDDEQKYTRLLGEEWLTVSGAFRRAGWRTVVSIPSSPSPWPEGERFYGFDRMYGTDDVDYAGPRFNYAKVPDQYTLAALHRLELQPQPRPPVMAEVDLVSSHAPWAALPQLVPWESLGRGEVYEPMIRQAQSPAAVLRDPARARAAYGAAIEYSLDTVVSFVTTYGDPDLVVVMLGDHQPATVVTGEGAGADVPITVIARDPAVLDRIDSWGWEDGMLPSPSAPVWRMDAFRERFLAAYR